MSAAAPPTLDLRGRPPAEQMRAAHEAVERAAAGDAVRIVTELDVVATYVLPAAAERGVRCRLEPSSGGVREMSLTPGGAPPADADGGEANGADTGDTDTEQRGGTR